MDIEVLVDGEGFSDIEIVQVPLGSTAGAIVTIVAARSGFPEDAGILFVEDGEQPVDLARVVVDEATARVVHHVHRAREVEVTVFYKNMQRERRFTPSARVQRVLDWAVGHEGFNIDAATAPEMELALHGQSDALPKSAHIGRYVRHPHDNVALDLIRGIVPNGFGQ